MRRSTVAASLTIVGVDLLANARPWTYWIAFPVFAMSVIGIAAMFLNYFRKAVAAKYPKQ